MHVNFQFKPNQTKMFYTVFQIIGSKMFGELQQLRKNYKIHKCLIITYNLHTKETKE